MSTIQYHIAVIGESNTGKTSYITRLCMDEVDPRYSPTMHPREYKLTVCVTTEPYEVDLILIDGADAQTRCDAVLLFCNTSGPMLASWPIQKFMSKEVREPFVFVDAKYDTRLGDPEPCDFLNTQIVPVSVYSRMKVNIEEPIKILLRILMMDENLEFRNIDS